MYTESIISKTPRFPGERRGKEIKHWLDHFSQNIDAFVVIDDDSDMEPLMDNLIKTSSKVGLDWHTCEKIEDYFAARGIKSKHALQREQWAKEREKEIHDVQVLKDSGGSQEIGG